MLAPLPLPPGDQRGPACQAPTPSVRVEQSQPPNAHISTPALNQLPPAGTSTEDRGAEAGRGDAGGRGHTFSPQQTRLPGGGSGRPCSARLRLPLSSLAQRPPGHLASLPRSHSHCPSLLMAKPSPPLRGEKGMPDAAGRQPGQSRGTAPASGLQTAGEWPRARPLSPSRPPPPIPSRLPSLVPCPHLRHSMPCPAHRTSSPRASRAHPSPSPTGSPEERRARGPGPWLPPACSREGGGCAEVRHGDETALGAIGAMTWGGGRGQREGITP